MEGPHGRVRQDVPGLRDEEVLQGRFGLFVLRLVELLVRVVADGQASEGAQDIGQVRTGGNLQDIPRYSLPTTNLSSSDQSMALEARQPSRDLR